MTVMTTFLRPWRDSAFRILALALAVAALSLASIVLLRAELEQRFDVRTAEVLGGDLVLVGSYPATDAQRDILGNLRQAEIADFPTVLVHDEEMLLVAARAAADSYPLYGALQIADDRFGPAYPAQGAPPPGELWVADQALDRLGLRLGEQITVGRKALTLTRIIRQEPDQGAGFYNMNPRILFNSADLEATGILGPGTRVGYRLMLAGDSADISAAEAALPETLRPDQRLDTVADAATRTMGPMRQLTLWVSLGVLLVSLLCGAAIYLATTQRVRRRARMAALLRSFGARRSQVLTRLLGQEGLAVMPAALLGSLAGVLLILVLRNTLGWEGPLAAGLTEWLTLLFGPLVLWLAFALPRLTTLVRTPAMQVLNDRLAPRQLAGVIELAAALGAPVLLAALLTGSLRELAQLLALLVLLGALLPALLWPLLKALDLGSRHLPLSGRLAVRRLSRRPGLTLPLLASLTVAMAVLGLAGQTGNQLLSEWRQKLPENAPNHFVFNLFDNDLPRFQDWVAEHGARAEPAYPVVRGRLTEVNGIPVRDAVAKESDQSERALNRDLILTEARTLPASNRIREGAWQADATGEVSVEEDLARTLGLSLGDALQFTTSQGMVSAHITSIREVDWESFEPNFYFMFAGDGLAGQDITWLSSFWLPEGDGARLAALLRDMPHITVLDVNAILDQAQDVISQASRATGLMAVLLMAAAILVLMAALLGAQAQRGRDNALLRTLGGSRQLIRRVTWLESLTLGGGAALGATLIMLAALYPLAQRLFNGSVPWSLWLLLPTLVGLMVAVAGVAMGAGARRQPPLALLRQEAG
ncbi:MAG: ABC transporter permease [Alcanivorax sp.]|nr:ABC transporter permease [Alcanivorax sp.]